MMTKEEDLNTNRQNYGNSSEQGFNPLPMTDLHPRDFDVEEIGFWVNGDYIFGYQLNMAEMINEENNNADLRVSSSIFYNFFD